jgi:preprotein translocase SecE subunit
MASVTNDREEKTMATDAMAPGAEEPESNRPRERAEKVESAGFFTIHKKGQGYWTRICTAAGTGLLILLTAGFLWRQLPPQLQSWFLPANLEKLTPTESTAAYARADRLANNTTLAICAVVVIGMVLLTWNLMNKPSNVDFLIATDSEMKKVNWTSKRELIGSTKVVIFFMFLIAIVLFVLDMYFTRVFYLAGVLAADSPLWEYFGSLFGAAAKPAKVALDIIMGVIVFGGTAWAIYGASKSR